MQKQTFYRLDSKGKIREWSIDVVDNGDGTATLFTYAGIQGGKIQTVPTPINSGKNIGRANETTAYQQAVLDAQTEINSKIKEGYGTDINNLKGKGDTATIKDPMKGDSYHPTGKKDKSLTIDTAGPEKHKTGELKGKPVGIRGKRIGIQRKLDGWRFRIYVNRTEIKFYTSSGDLTLSFPQIEKVIREKFDANIDYWEKKYGVTEYYLDGEIYNHKLGFNATASACASVVNITPDKQALRDAMQFHIFDVCNSANYETRQKIANNFVDGVWVLSLETIIINADEKAIDDLFEKFLKEGYEGLMIRLLDMPYEFKRSKQLLKYKPEEDGEFKLVGFEESTEGNTLGALVLEMPNGETFTAAPKGTIGTDKMRKTIWNNQKDYIGKWVTVNFMEYTIYGKPRNGKAKGFRKGPSAD